MSLLAVEHQPTLPGHFSSSCCSTHCRGKRGGGWIGYGKKLHDRDWIVATRKNKRFRCDTLLLRCCRRVYLRTLHGWRRSNGTPQRQRAFTTELEVHTQVIQAWSARANSRLRNCSGCWFITFTRSRPILLIIIFVKLIISVSVSTTVSMNYIQITLINQQNEFLGKCFFFAYGCPPCGKCLLPFPSFMMSKILIRKE